MEIKIGYPNLIRAVVCEEYICDRLSAVTLDFFIRLSILLSASPVKISIESIFFSHVFMSNNLEHDAVGHKLY